MNKRQNDSIPWLAGKYLRGRSARFVNRSHYLTIAGIMLGVAALICVSSVMNGFRDDMRGRIIGAQSEIRIRMPDGSPLASPDSLAGLLRREGFLASPVVRNELVLKKDNAIFPALAFGVEPKYHAGVSELLSPLRSSARYSKRGLIAGSLADTLFINDGIALGATLAEKLGVMPGDSVQMLSPLFDVPTAFGLLPRVRSLRVAAVFRADMPEYDGSYCFIPLELARYFSDYSSEADYIEVKTPDFNKVTAYSRQLRKLHPSLKVEDWSSFDASLYSAMRFEKYMMFVIMLLMYVIASFNLTGNMLKAIAQKKRELGILQALGYDLKALRGLFLHQSLRLSTLGILLGLLLAGLLLGAQSVFGVIRLNLGDAIPLPLPVILIWSDVVGVIFASYLITLVSVILPLRRLRRINPVALIRQTA